jgi:hypothetical protein
MPQKPLFKGVESITKFDMYLSISLMQCDLLMKHDCVYNKTIYDEIKKGKYEFRYTSLIKANMFNVFDDENPYISKIQKDFIIR